MTWFFRGSRAFTLVELLVAVLIVAALVALALPSFLTETQAAENSAAQQNLRVAYEGAATYHAFQSSFGTQAELVADALAQGDPELTFQVYEVDNPATYSTGPTDITVALEPEDPSNIITLCTKANSGTYFCERSDALGKLAVNARRSTARTELASFDVPTLAYAQGQTEPDAIAALPNRGADAGKNAGTAQTGEPTWTATSAPGPAAAPTATTGTATSTQPTTSATTTTATTPSSSADAPVNTAIPGITGSPVQGQTLSGSVGAWTGTPALTYAYQWQDCDAHGGGCAPITGATAATYQMTASDVGHTVRLAVTASNIAGSATASSLQTGVVQAGLSNDQKVVGDDRPSAWCRLDELGTANVTFSCGAFDGTLNGPASSFTTGASGALVPSGDMDAAVSFNGTAQTSSGPQGGYMSANDGGDWTVEGWVRPATAAPSQVMASVDDAWALRLDGRSGFACDTTNGNGHSPVVRTATGGQAALAGRWYYVACTHTNGTLSLYVNGVLVGTDHGGADQSTSGLLRLGYESGGWTTGSSLNGTLDELAFYQDALSPAQIASHYDAAGY